MSNPKAPSQPKGTSQIVRQFTVQADDDGVRLDRWFKRHLPQVGFATVSRWARTGQIRLDGKRADVADRIATGQVLRVPPGGDAAKGAQPKRELTEAQLEMADAMVIHRDRSAIVINKPPGLATQGGSGTFEHVDGLLDAYAPNGPRPRLVHRLDKDTSGVLLVAATPGSAAFFSRRFSGRSARKIYWALVVGVPSIDDGLIELPLSKQPGTGGEKMMVDESGAGQTARTRYRVLDRAGNSAAWVELQPLTGRTHQLRVHMAAIGFPIVGDGKYGGQAAFLSGTISRKMHLHARRLIIEHPDGVPLDVVAELPEHFANSMAQLGFDQADGEALPEAPAVPPREALKTAAKAHAKQYRKERRGERHKRTEGSAPTRKPTGQRAGKSVAKGVTGKPAAGKPGLGKAGIGKTGGRTAAPGKPAAPKAPPRKR
ncbi:MAG: RluA family pseudouridine synthase [Sphingomonadales bacterium]|nr:RluA family pseudouridine synthase [Sphingomonadales bacterium]